MLKLAGRKFALSLGLAVSLASSSIASAWGTLDLMTLCCPATVWAGSPINGYVAGGEVPMSVSSSSPLGLPGFFVVGPGDPLPFSIPTHEPQIGSIVTVMAQDRSGQCISKLVFVL